MAETVLSSEWGALSPHLIASFYVVDREGKRKQDAEVTVKAPLTDASLEVSLNWQSPFEQAGPETKAPTLFAMLQSGSLQPLLDNLASGGKADGSSIFQQFEGRTGITKLNSVQVFNGMPPIKINVQAQFRAWKNPVTEVTNPVDQLMEWALPVELASDSTLLTELVGKLKDNYYEKGSKSWVNAVLPSQAPVLVAMQYKGRTYAPLVIESISLPLSSPIDASGNFVELQIPMTLCSLTALDRKDWTAIKSTKTVSL